MANSKEIHTKIKDLFEEFDTNHEIHSEKGNKAAGGRARKAIGEIKKLVTAYRKASVSESKWETYIINLHNSMKNKRNKIEKWFNRHNHTMEFIRTLVAIIVLFLQLIILIRIFG